MDLQGIAKALRDAADFLEEKDALLKQSGDLKASLGGYKENITKANAELVSTYSKVAKAKAEYEAEAKRLSEVKKALEDIRSRVV